MRPESRVLLRTETDPVRAFTFLQVNHYPFFWSPDDLSRGLVVRIMDHGGETVGYSWGDWLDTGVLAFHACVLSGSRLPIFTSDFLDQLVRIGFLVGADEVVTSVDDHPTPRPLQRLLRRLGFEEVRNAHGKDTCFTLNTWSYLGQSYSPARSLGGSPNPDERQSRREGSSDHGSGDE